MIQDDKNYQVYGSNIYKCIDEILAFIENVDYVKYKDTYKVIRE